MADALKQRIQDDTKTAMKAKESHTVTTLRMLTAAIKQREIDEKITLNDAAILAVINKMIKQRRDAAQQFTDAKRDELAQKENDEIVMLQAYLPKQLTDSEIEDAIKKAIKDTNASSMKDMGKVMGTLKPQLEGRADMGAVSSKIKSLLT